MFVFYTRIMDSRPLPDRVAALAALDDPARLAVFDHVARAATAVSRDAAATALGVSRRVGSSKAASAAMRAGGHDPL